MDTSTPPTFFPWPQDLAVIHFPSILQSHLPQSNPLYNRIVAPQNTPDRHCLFAATFPPPIFTSELASNSVAASSVAPPSSYTIVFGDRSRHAESQLWVFHPYTTSPTALSTAQREELQAHLKALLLFQKNLQLPEAPGWPFSPICRFGCLHEVLGRELEVVAEQVVAFHKAAQAENRSSDTAPTSAIVRKTSWNFFTIALQNPTISTHVRTLSTPAGFHLCRVPEDQLDAVISTSSIPRQRSTLLGLPNSALIDSTNGTMAAWAYIGIDSSFATLYVQPAYRGRAFATVVAVALLRALRDGEFAADIRGGRRGFDGKSGFVHSDVHEGNEASMAVMRRLGGETRWGSSYIWVDTDMIDE